jgi:hypothetical protein
VIVAVTVFVVTALQQGRDVLLSAGTRRSWLTFEAKGRPIEKSGEPKA